MGREDDSKKAEQELARIRKLPENRKCANCLAPGAPLLTAVVVPFRVFVCSTCKSAHQSFSHRCKSTQMSLWTMDEVRQLEERNGGGNKVAQDKWFARCSDSTRPKEGDSLDRVKDFVNRAYNEERWLDESGFNGRVESRSRRGDGHRNSDQEEVGDARRADRGSRREAERPARRLSPPRSGQQRQREVRSAPGNDDFDPNGCSGSSRPVGSKADDFNPNGVSGDYRPTISKPDDFDPNAGVSDAIFDGFVSAPVQGGASFGGSDNGSFNPDSFVSAQLPAPAPSGPFDPFAPFAGSSPNAAQAPQVPSQSPAQGYSVAPSGAGDAWGAPWSNQGSPAAMGMTPNGGMGAGMGTGLGIEIGAGGGGIGGTMGGGATMGSGMAGGAAGCGSMAGGMCSGPMGGNAMGGNAMIGNAMNGNAMNGNAMAAMGGGAMGGGAMGGNAMGGDSMGSSARGSSAMGGGCMGATNGGSMCGGSMCGGATGSGAMGGAMGPGFPSAMPGTVSMGMGNMGQGAMGPCGAGGIGAMGCGSVMCGGAMGNPMCGGAPSGPMCNGSMGCGMAPVASPQQWGPTPTGAWGGSMCNGYMSAAGPAAGSGPSFPTPQVGVEDLKHNLGKLYASS